MIQKALIFLIIAFTGSSVVAEDVSAEQGRHWDFNGDGTEDLWVVESNGAFIELRDRNFDGKPDERFEYDSRTNWLLYGMYDDDFDGYFETLIVVKNNMPVHDLVDTNKDRCIDTVFEYVNGVLVSAQQFRESEQTGNREIVSFEYEYGIHVHENHEPTDLDPCEFHAEVMGRMPSTPSMAR